MMGIRIYDDIYRRSLKIQKLIAWLAIHGSMYDF